MAEEKTFYQEYEVFSKRTPSFDIPAPIQLTGSKRRYGTRFGTGKFHAPRTGY